MLYYEDLSLESSFCSREYPLSAESIKAFAREYDPQPFHLDEAAAENTFFGGLVASGWHTSAIAMRLMAESVPIAGGLVGAGIDELRWFRPVRPGDSLHLESRVESMRVSASKPHQGIIKVKHTLLNQHNEPVEQFYSTMIIPRQQTSLSNPENAPL